MLLYRLARYRCKFRRIKLTQGQYAIVDAWRYEELNKYNWYAHKNKNTYYAYRAAKAGEKRKSRCIKMHSEVLRLQKTDDRRLRTDDRGQKTDDRRLNERVIIDHKNGDGRDNREANLRQANYSQNSQNRKKIKRICGSQYKGVWLDKKTGKWRAQICYGGKKKHLGYYSNEAEAARVYDNAAMRYHGRFAKLNFRKDTRHKEQLIADLVVNRN